jgi:hypothetical protein
MEKMIECPHCKEYIIIEQINCGIFRHGILKSNLKQINPHSSEELCKFYIDTNKIYGCGKPFQIVEINNQYEITICGYI